MKEMAKFAAGGYACHILTPAQKAETTQMLAAIVDDPSDLPIDQQFTCPGLWTLWKDAEGQPVPIAPPAVDPIPAAPVAQAPEVRPVMRYGLNNAQATARAALQNPPPVAAPVVAPETQVPVPIAGDSNGANEADANPRPQQRQRRTTRSRSKYKVGARVKMHAWRFGEVWNMEEFNSFNRSRTIEGKILSSAGVKKWNIMWNYDGEISMRPQKELLLIK